jgi:YqjK-like protein
MRVDYRLRQLAIRREALCKRVRSQREQFALAFTPVTLAAHRADERIAGVTRLARNPMVITATAVSLMFIGPGRLLRWAKKGLEAWLIWRSFAPKLAAMFPRRFG